MSPKGGIPKPPIERFMSKIENNSTTDCWLWSGATNRKSGYGYFTLKRGTVVLAHRFSYEHFNGEIPEGLQIDHLCRVRHCVNPDHLEVVTRKENAKRGVWGGRTHCINGHEFSPENTIMYQDHRICRTCRDLKNARHNAERRYQGA